MKKIMSDISCTNINSVINPKISGVGIYVPYQGALRDVDIGDFTFTAGNININNLIVTTETSIGLGTISPTSKIEMVGSLGNTIRETSTNYILGIDDYTLRCIGSNIKTITLPMAVLGRIYNITNQGTGDVTIQGTSNQTIDGESTQVINQYETITVQASSNEWSIL